MRLISIFSIAALLCMLFSRMGWHISSEANIAAHTIRGCICVLIANIILYLFQIRVRMWVERDIDDWWEEYNEKESR